ncbi:MAG: DNA polymerase IV [Chloroflexota bacterium]
MAGCIFHIDLDAFFVSVEQALNPELKGKPVIVGGDPERRGVVASASYEARPFGIYAGMPSAKAHQLCPQAIFIRSHFSLYKDASAKFMKILCDFCPRIEALGFDEAYLDVTGCEEPYGSLQKLALAIKERINEELNLTASVGIATCKVVAKIASDLCKPDGLLEIAPGEEQAFLNPLPIAKLPGVGKKTEQALKDMGITTIGELASLPLDSIKRHFGATGAVLHSYARGIDDREVEAPGEAKSISQELTFARDTLDCNFLESNLHNLCQEVCQDLRSQNKRTKCVAIKLRYADFKTITRQVTLQEASDVTPVVFATAQQLLSKALAQRGKPIRLIGIRISSLAGEGKQLPMFDSGTEKPEHLDKAIDKIRSKYGSTAIKTGNGISSEGT